MRPWNVLAALIVGIATYWISTPHALAVNHNEGTNGDLSNNGNAPTSLNLTAGTNSVIATMPAADLDFLTVHVPTNHQLTALMLASYAGGGDGTAFIGMKTGTTIAVTSNPAQLNGYTHFGTGPGNVGQDILDNIGQGAGATGFTPPLGAGAYSFWIQQASGANTSYQFDFVVNALAVPGLTGDYNDDDVVDAADYVVWRDSLGGTTLPNRDPQNMGAINEDDYNSWRANFGRSPGGAAAVAAAPEPTSLLLAVGVAIGALLRTRSRKLLPT